ncbi:hypothetical protein GNP92_09080 [Paenibacillus timonensis]|nr:hypothetical protein [Paenibacillus timonensis]MUG86493.1 hypothetical protein [Paenibacillus timonensis]
MTTFFTDMDNRLKNIESLKHDFFDEACILIYVYLDYLNNYTNKLFPGQGEHRKNFRHFIMNYSNLKTELKCLQINRFLNDYCKDEAIRTKYKHYYEKIEEQIESVRSGVEIPLHSFFSLDDVDQEDKRFFSRYTIANSIYDYRNNAIHEYRNAIDYGGFIKVPFLSYTSNIFKDQEGWFTTEIPFSFLRALLLNCYSNVRNEYEVFIKERFPEGLA